MVKSGTLFLVAIAFGAGFLFGFSYHHIVDEHHEQTREHTVTHAARPGPTDTQWQRFEARLAALEKREKQVTAAVPTAQAPEVQHHAEAPAGGGRNGHAKLPALKLPALGAATSAPAGCKGKRKPYHIVLTAQDSPYQAWQTRIMYYHFKKLQKANPCTEMTGFTRMLNSDGARRDGLMDEMPTTLVHALDRGSGCHDSDQNTCDMGFPVMNRPHGVTQLLAQLDRGEHHIEEEYVLIAETDHVFMKEPKNRATPKMPACFPFGYMNAQAEPLRGVVQRFVSANPKDVDPCGPSPVLIHLPQLRKLTPEWLSMSFALKRDAEADKHFGWVLEMWGYTLAATKLGIRHFVWRDLQTEPSALWHSDLDGEPHIYHYTFGLEYTSDGMPVTGGVGDWSLDKRHFMNEYPPPDMAAPPRCAGKAAHRLHAMFNEAIAGTPQWPAKHAARGTVGWGPGAAAGLHAVDDEMYHQQPAVQRLVTQGPWKLGGKVRPPLPPAALVDRLSPRGPPCAPRRARSSSSGSAGCTRRGARARGASRRRAAATVRAPAPRSPHRSPPPAHAPPSASAPHHRARCRHLARLAPPPACPAHLRLQPDCHAPTPFGPVRAQDTGAW